MARPKKEINTSQVEALAAINCSLEEIASVIDCDVRTLTRRFAQVIKKGRDQGKSSLKRKMWDIALGGNVTMCIWLSKQMLGYTDKKDIGIDHSGSVSEKSTVVILPSNGFEASIESDANQENQK